MNFEVRWKHTPNRLPGFRVCLFVFTLEISCQTWLTTISQRAWWQRIFQIKSTPCPVKCEHLQYFYILVFMASFTHQRHISGFGNSEIWANIELQMHQNLKKSKLLFTPERPLLVHFLPSVSSFASLWLIMSLLQNGSVPLYFVAIEIWILWLTACKWDGLVVRWLK